MKLVKVIVGMIAVLTAVVELGFADVKRLDGVTEEENED